MPACADRAKKEAVPILDARTFAACRQGDREAFRRLFDAYKDQVYSIALYFLNGDVATAEDIAQDVFVRLYTRMGQFRNQSEFSTWLYRIIANACMDEFRRRKHRPETACWDETDGLVGGSGGEQPSEIYARIELSEAVHKALNELGPEMRLTILLRYLEERSYEEIADALACSQGTVASRLNRGLKTLAGKLTIWRDSR